MLYNELRKDYLLNRWVVIANERARRPTDFVKPKPEPTVSASCPLCPGNEHMTPPATLVYLPKNGAIEKDADQGDLRRKNWLIRSVPNMYPAFSPPKNQIDAKNILKNESYGCAIGHHEVIVESPNHNDHPSNAQINQMTLLIESYKDRLESIIQHPYVQYAQIFRNYGIEAGASLSHAHSQIIATPFVPSIVQQEVQASRNYHKQQGTCVFCDLIKQEAQTKRLILSNDYFTVFAPYASIHPLEFWIIPKTHSQNILTLTKTETQAFAQTIQITLKALKNLVNDPPYNYGIHLSLNKESKDYYHWHLEVYPHLAIWAGFEKSTGMYINTVIPETAAAELKKSLESKH